MMSRGSFALLRAILASLALSWVTINLASAQTTILPMEQPQATKTDGIKLAQRSLKSLGLYKGKIDGLWGRGSMAAIGEFQRLIGARRGKLKEEHVRVLIASGLIRDARSISVRAAIELAPDLVKSQTIAERASSLAKEGKFDEALQATNSVLATRQFLLGQHHEETLRVAGVRASLMFLTGQPGQAKQEFENLLPVMKSVFGLDHEVTLQSESMLELVRQSDTGSASARRQNPLTTDLSANVSPWPAAKSSGPSFDCTRARSRPEKLICTDDELSKQDRELARIYNHAKARAAATTFTGDRPRSALATFEADSDAEWKWREENCSQRDCLLKWYAKRKALLSWVAYSKDGFGDLGIERVEQLENGDTIISYGMVTHIRNVIVVAATGESKQLPDGDIRVIQQNPFMYMAMGQKGLFNVGGAFWFSTIRDSRNRIISFVSEGSNCMPFMRFIERTSFSPADLALVSAQEVCVEN